MKETEPKHHINLKFKIQILTSKARGITLIALLITIIAMLILVGVTVNVAINGGLFSTAKRATSETQKEQEIKQRVAARINASLHDEKWEYEAADGAKIPIPEGFAPTEIEGENTINEGIVITDANGNEFVWIPCTRADYENANIESGWTRTEYNNKTWTDEQTEIGAESIEKNKGFYVARYEAGIIENAPFYASEDGDTYEKNTGKKSKNTDSYLPVSKRGVPAWNFINQTNAEAVSKKMYPNNSAVSSYLIDSHAWNLICKNILQEKAGKNIKDSTSWGNYSNNVTTKYKDLDVLYAVHPNNDNSIVATENYSKGLIPESAIPKENTEINTRLELSTGASEDFKAYNIYDMAGNMWEWTTETGKSNDETSIKTYAVIRSGSFHYTGTSDPVVISYGKLSTDYSNYHVGFRVVLYFK